MLRAVDVRLGKDGSPGTYLGIVGLVYDVAAGKEFYGPGQGYSFFAGVGECPTPP